MPLQACAHPNPELCVPMPNPGQTVRDSGGDTPVGELRLSAAPPSAPLPLFAIALSTIGTRLQQPHGVGGWRGCARSRRVALVPPGVHVKRGRTLEVSARRALRTRRCAAGAGALVDRAAVVVNATAYRIPWSDIRVSRGRMCGVRIRYCHLRHINARA